MSQKTPTDARFYRLPAGLPARFAERCRAAGMTQTQALTVFMEAVCAGLVDPAELATRPEWPEDVLARNTRALLRRRGKKGPAS